MFDISIPPVNREAARAAHERISQLTKPVGSLGRIEELAEWLSAIHGELPPSPYERRAILVGAADHGVAAEGVSAYPSDVTVADGRSVSRRICGDQCVRSRRPRGGLRGGLRRRRRTAAPRPFVFRRDRARNAQSRTRSRDAAVARRRVTARRYDGLRTHSRARRSAGDRAGRYGDREHDERCRADLCVHRSGAGRRRRARHWFG